MSYYPYEFRETVVAHDFGKFAYTVVYLPDELVGELPLKKFPRLRINAEVNEFELEAALQPTAGRWFLLLSKRVLKACDAALGDSVRVRFCIADQDAVNVPEELQQALNGDANATSKWEALTPGKQRSFAYRVASAKRLETRLKRVNEVFEMLDAGV